MGNKCHHLALIKLLTSYCTSRLQSGIYLKCFGFDGVAYIRCILFADVLYKMHAPFQNQRPILPIRLVPCLHSKLSYASNPCFCDLFVCMTPSTAVSLPPSPAPYRRRPAELPVCAGGGAMANAARVPDGVHKSSLWAGGGMEKAEGLPKEGIG